MTLECHICDAVGMLNDELCKKCGGLGTLKACKSCQEEYSLHHFSKKSSSPDGHGDVCLECRKEYRTRHNQGHQGLTKRY